MSTRSIIKFCYDDTDHISVYKHWDGYPESTVPLIQEFLKWNGSRNGDLSYTVANFCYWFKSNRDNPSLDGDDDNHHTGLGILSSGDVNPNVGEEFVYTVDLGKSQSIKENFGTKGMEWNFHDYEEEIEDAYNKEYVTV